MKYIFKDMNKEIVIYGILTLFLSIVMVSEAYLLQFIIDSMKLNESKYIVMAILVVLFLFVQTLIYYFQQLLTAVLSKKAAYVYRLQIFNNIQKLPFELLTGEKNEKLLASLTTQIDQLEYNYFYSIFWGGYLICQLVVAVIISFYFNPILSIFTIILSLPNLFVALFFKNSLEKKQDELIEETNLSIFKIQDLIAGVSDWKVANKQINIFNIFRTQTLELLKKQVQIEKSQYIVVSLNQLFSNVLYFGSWIVGGLFIIRGQLTLGSLIAFSQLLSRISYPVYASSDLLTKYISGKKTLQVLSREFIQIDISPNVENKIDEISLSNFLLDNSREVKPLNFTFKKNKKYLLRGKSGIGKSTILRAILRERNNYQGTIKINGVDVKSIKESNIFNHIGYVPQHPYLFNASLKDNITLFSDNYSHKELFDILKFVELSQWANEDSLKMIISSEEVNISGGEAKRVSLARALLAKKDVLLLDEFSSGIDYDTLLKVERKLLDLDKILVYVTHVDIDREGRHFDDVIDLNKLFSD